MKTDLQLKQFLAERLPEYLTLNPIRGLMWKSRTKYTIGQSVSRLTKDTEIPYIVGLVEGQLNPSKLSLEPGNIQWTKYVMILSDLVGPHGSCIAANWQTRAQALIEVLKQ